MNMKNKDNMSVVDFQQLNILLNDGSKVLIDVRYMPLPAEERIPSNLMIYPGNQITV